MKTIKEYQIEALSEYLKDKVLQFHKLEQIVNEVLELIEMVEVDYHNRWEEMRLEEQYQEKPE